MKKIILGCLISLTVSNAFAERFHAEDYSKALENLSGDKAQIFEKSKQWVAQNFNSSKDVLQYENKDQGRLIVKGTTSPKCDSQIGKLECYGYSQAQIGFTLTIDIQDHRARLLFQNMNYALHNNAPLDDPITDRLVKNRFNEVIDSFQAQESGTSDKW
ncbi:DUF4468 domain-containing protein [Acinetobacter pollinis]|uniref:DUF4468 domain-containing protein n=1 Tax=Acinetobacter pollinis TaxID=2605270 RepID=A0ABU6DQ54_9GAMM|nr:DUF4468 domain-containing protein [Acinetobacter pollinis]MEB5475995.1 DUF4468 domain-containing protein [Acinetobacter pollinis]